MSQVYSFADVLVTFTSPIGSYTTEGVGMGTIGLAYANDNSVQDNAADGRVQTSKVLAKNGSITLTMQQTSPLHHWLLNWYNNIYQAATTQWNATSVSVNHNLFGEFSICTGVSPLKPADQPYQSQAQEVTWTLLSEHINRTAPSPVDITALDSVSTNLNAGVTSTLNTSARILGLDY